MCSFSLTHCFFNFAASVSEPQSPTTASIRIRDVVLIIPHLMYDESNICAFATLYIAKSDNGAGSMLTLYSKLIQL